MTAPAIDLTFMASKGRTTPRALATQDDYALLRRYADFGCEAAFSELVARYGPIVYSAALRQVGRAELAQDVAQAAFILLARKAGRLDAATILGAWLHKVTRYAAMNATRAEQRRRRHERKAAEMIAARQLRQIRDADPAHAAAKHAATSVAWGEGMRLLDAGIAGLPARDREAIVLRFLQRQSLAEVGAALGVSEDAAQMRVSRAIDRLRHFYQRRGLTMTAAQMGAAVGVNAQVAMPASFAASLAPAALHAAASPGGTAASTLAASAARSMAIARGRVVGAVMAAAVVLFLVCFQIGSAIVRSRVPAEATHAAASAAGAVRP